MSELECLDSGFRGGGQTKDFSTLFKKAKGGKAKRRILKIRFEVSPTMFFSLFFSKKVEKFSKKSNTRFGRFLIYHFLTLLEYIGVSPGPYYKKSHVGLNQCSRVSRW